MYDASKEIFHASSLDSTALKKKKKNVTNSVPRDLPFFVYHN